MSHTSRRSFLVGAGAVTTTAAVTPAAFATPAFTPSSARAHAHPFVASVTDPESSTIVIYVGTEARTVHDRDLVRRLARAAGR